MLKDLGTDKYHQNLYSKIKKEIESSKKTDSSDEYQVDNIENLFLYCLGKGPTPLTMSEVEDAVGWEMVGGFSKNNSSKGKPKFRQNYVYKIEKRLFHESEFVPSKLIFALDDDFIEYDKNEYRINLSDEFKVRITKYFRHLFRIEDETFYPFFEEVHLCNIGKRELIIALKISDHKSNYLRIEINISKLEYKAQIKSLKDKSKGLKGEDLRLFIGSLSSTSEIELNVYKKREKGRLAVRDHEIITKIHLKNYIDNVSPNNSRKKYVLNLRGLLKYLSSFNRKIPHKKINRVIENLSRVDNYWTIENELFDFHFIAMDPLQETENFISKKGLVEHRVKQGFPFLSFHNQYKRLLPRNYASQILVEVALGLIDKLETLEIADLKYQVTDIFFTKIQDYFWESSGLSEPRIEDSKLIPESVLNTLKEYQTEIQYYLSQIKEIKSKLFIRQGEYYEEYNSRNDLKQKILRYLNENQKAVIWIKDVLYPNDPDSMPFGLTGNELGVIEEICESSGLDYVTNRGSFLFQKTEIEKIKGCLESNMPLEMAKKLVLKHGISNEGSVNLSV